MTHVYALGHLLGAPVPRALVDHGVAALQGRSTTTRTVAGSPRSVPRGLSTTSKTAYEHAFVVLAAASAAAAGRPGARDLLDEALTVLLDRFWDETTGWSSRSGTGVDRARSLPRGQRQHAQRGGAARGGGRARRPVTAGAGVPDHLTRVVGDLARRQPLAAPGALRRGVGTVARLQRRRAGPPVPAVRRHGRPRAGVGAARAARAGRTRDAAARLPAAATRARSSTPRFARAGTWTGPRFRLHRRLGRPARRTGADALGRC